MFKNLQSRITGCGFAIRTIHRFTSAACRVARTASVFAWRPLSRTGYVDSGYDHVGVDRHTLRVRPARGFLIDAGRTAGAFAVSQHLCCAKPIFRVAHDPALESPHAETRFDDLPTLQSLAGRSGVN